MDPRSFLRAIPKELPDRLPAELRAFHSTTGFGLAKVWYGNRDLHYEVWVRPRLRTLELGLHFEADPLTNARLLAAFGAHERKLRRALGAGVRIEEWDRGWARVWEPITPMTLDAELLERVSARVAEYVRALEPILRDELPRDVPWSLADERSSARPSRRPRSARR